MQEILAQEEKMLGMEWTFDQDSASAPAIEKILASLGWSPPILYLIRLHFDAYAFNPPWIHRPFLLPTDMHFFSWKDLLPQDKETIQYLRAQGRFLPYLSPLYQEESIDLETSIGLRKEGALVGWSITRRPDSSTILYSSLYIDSSLLYAGYGIQLLIESIRRHKKLPIPNALFEINLKEIDPSWWHFVNKRLLPLTSKVEKIQTGVPRLPRNSKPKGLSGFTGFRSQMLAKKNTHQAMKKIHIFLVHTALVQNCFVPL